MPNRVADYNQIYTYCALLQENMKIGMEVDPKPEWFDFWLFFHPKQTQIYTKTEF